MAETELTLPQDQDLTTQLLAPRAFTDPGVLAAEQERIFARAWLNVGLAAQVPNPGDVRPITACGRPLLIARDRDGVVRVFHNVCRHRGHQLVAKCDNLSRIVCPYHAFTYELNGGLFAVPHWNGERGAKPPPQVMAQLSLVPVRSVVWADIVFVNLSGDADDFDTFVGPLATRWKPYDLSRFYLAECREYEAGGNWKLAIENFLDSYHFPVVHRKYGTYEVMLRFSHLRVSRDIFGYHMPTGESDKPKAGAPLPALDLPPALQPAQDILYLYPNTLLIITATWLQVLTLSPRTPSVTDETLAVYMVRTAGEDPAVEQTKKDFLTAANEINDQDMPVLAGLQSGMASDAGAHNQYTRFWDENPYLFHRRMLETGCYDFSAPAVS